MGVDILFGFKWNCFRLIELVSRCNGTKTFYGLYLCFTVTSLLCGLANSLGMLLFRLLQGIARSKIHVTRRRQRTVFHCINWELPLLLPGLRLYWHRLLDQCSVVISPIIFHGVGFY